MWWTTLFCPLWFIIYHHQHTVTYFTLSSGKGERSLLAVWSCEGNRSSVLHESMKNLTQSPSFLDFFFHKEKWRKTSTQSEDHLRNISLNAQYCNAHKDGMHAGKDACGLCVYLSHTLSSLLSLIQGSGVQRFIGNKIRALNVINGFDFWNGS